MIRHTISIGGRRVVYWERNPHWHETIVLLHGFRGNHKGLTDLAQHLDGFRLIMPDLPGYGESEPLERPHTLENYAEGLDGFVGALHLGEWHSWSHSYSGSLSLIQAARGRHKPVTVVSVSLAAVRQDLASLLSTWYYRLGETLPESWRRRWIASRTVDRVTGRWLFVTVTTRRRLALMERGDRNLPLLNPEVVTQEYMSALGLNLKWYAARVHMPVMIIAGAKDVIVPLQRLEDLVAKMPNGQLVVMPDQGHLAPIERPAHTATLTKRFIHGLH
jgi:pimeloyl-ACP methyl ester carboxylesterase